MNERVFLGKLGLQQRVLPAYRAAFFDALASVCTGGLSVFAGEPLPGEGIQTTNRLDIARFEPARNRHLFQPGSPFFQCWQGGLLSWLQKWQPEALIVEANPRYRSTPTAVRWMKEHGRLVLGWGLGAPALSGPFASFRQRSRMRFLWQLDGVIAYSQRGAEEYRLLGLPAERVFVAPNASVPRPAAPPPDRPENLESRPAVLFVGRLQARKRLDNLLAACAAMSPDLQPHVWIVGDGPARPELEILAASAYPDARFYGARQGKELDDLFDAADLFVLPGTGGLAVQQAMAHGLPVIVAESDGTQEDLVRPENGWLVAPGDVGGLHKALVEALSDISALRRRGAVSYKIVAEEANLDRMVNAFIQALNTVAVPRLNVTRV